MTNKMNLFGDSASTAEEVSYWGPWVPYKGALVCADKEVVPIEGRPHVKAKVARLYQQFGVNNLSFVLKVVEVDKLCTSQEATRLSEEGYTSLTDFVVYNGNVSGYPHLSRQDAQWLSFQLVLNDHTANSSYYHLEIDYLFLYTLTDIIIGRSQEKEIYRNHFYSSRGDFVRFISQLPKELVAVVEAKNHKSLLERLIGDRLGASLTPDDLDYLINNVSRSFA